MGPRDLAAASCWPQLHSGPQSRAMGPRATGNVMLPVRQPVGQAQAWPRDPRRTMVDTDDITRYRSTENADLHFHQMHII